MAKLLIYGDIHWSTYSSIIRSRGDKYSKRLENLIKSVTWAEQLSATHNCDAVVCLGDFFDATTLNSEEATALQDVRWNFNLPHYFIVGNHETSTASLEYSSTKVLEAYGFTVVSETVTETLKDNTMITMIPYMSERDRLPLAELVRPNNSVRKVVFSHNDIKGINYGLYESKEGFGLDEIEQLTDYYINGHIHNGMFLNANKTILNLGILTGQNFNEDAYKYTHNACILDTETLEIEFIENPHAFNFYKLHIAKKHDLNLLTKLKNNAVITVRSEESLVSEVRELIKTLDNIVEYRVISYRESSLEISEGSIQELQAPDHLKQFYQFILDNVEDSVVSHTILKKELNKVIS